MIQDAFPVRSGIPDHYLAKLKIDVAAGPVYVLDQTRLPPNQFTVTRTGVGAGNVTFPPGMKVKGTGGTVDSKLVTAAQFDAWLTNINEAAGTCNIVIVSVAGALADPAVGAVIYADLDLETV